MNEALDITILADQISAIFDEGPESFDAWLASIPSKTEFNSADPCQCFMHNYLLSKANIDVDTYTDAICVPLSDARSTNGQHTDYTIIEFEDYNLPEWYYDFQYELMKAKNYTEEGWARVRFRSIDEARSALRAVVEVKELVTA